MDLTIMSWNVNRTKASWSFLQRLQERERAQVALLQEAVRPPVGVMMSVEPPVEDEGAWRLPVPRAKRHFCSAVAVGGGIAFKPVRADPLASGEYGAFLSSHPGQFAVAEVTLPLGGETVTVVSLYGIWDRVGERGDLYADASLHRAISDLAVLFQDPARSNLVVAGDLNVWHDYGRSTSLRGWSTAWAQRFDGVFARMAAHGLELIGPFAEEGEPPLERCPCESQTCRHVNTYLYRKDPANVPYQNDFMFASASMRARLTRCYAVMDPDVWDYSDHRPIVATFH